MEAAESGKIDDFTDAVQKWVEKYKIFEFGLKMKKYSCDFGPKLLLLICVFRYDSISRLDGWLTQILLAIKNRLQTGDNVDLC